MDDDLFVVVDIGCLECGTHPHRLVGIFPRAELDALGAEINEPDKCTGRRCSSITVAFPADFDIRLHRNGTWSPK